MSKNDKYEKMINTPVEKLVLSLSVPTIISMLISNIYNLADTAFVGKLGNSASGAVGIVFGFMAILQAIGFLFGQGGGSILSRQLGAKEEDKASVTASVAFFSAFFISFLVALVCGCFLQPIVMFLGSTDTIAPYASVYICCILMAAPFLVTSFTLNNFLRYEGRAFLGMIGMMTGAVLNILGDYILMQVLGMGIEGAGISTAVSQLISFSILFSMFARGKTTAKISFDIFWQCIQGKMEDAVFGCALGVVVSTGLPSLLRQGLSSIVSIVLNEQAGKYGDEGVAAMSIVARVGFFVFSVSLGIGQGFQPVGAFNYGAKRFDRLRKAFRFTVFISTAVLLVTSTICYLLSDHIIHVFRDDPTVIEMGTRALKLHCLGQMFIPFCMSMEMCLQCTGRKVSASVISVIRNGVVFVPLLLIMEKLRGFAGIQEAQPLSFAIAAIPVVFIAMHYFRTLQEEEDGLGIEEEQLFE
ncbi:MAG: MATE family efflux transporter [Lachnospiraceae bacterium]|nr:MATE family efflux transporter [Lachnospiraceae bacterium]